MADNRIEFVLEIDGRNFTVGLRNADKMLTSFNATVNKTSRQLESLEKGVNGTRAHLRDLFVTISTARSAFITIRQVTYDWVMGIVNANAKIERMRVLLSGLSTQANAAARAMEGQRGVDFITQMAQRAPFAIDKIATSLVKLKAGGIDPMNGSLQALLNGVARFGGDGEVLQRAATAIQQMAGKGVISMEELRQQLGEAVPNSIQVMARAVGISVADLVKKVSTGTMEAQGALAAFFVQLELETAGSAENLMGTWDGLVGQLQTKWLLFLNQLGGQGFFQKMKEELGNLIEAFDTNAMQQLAARWGQYLREMLEGIRDLAEFTRDNWDYIVPIAKIVAGIAALRMLTNMFIGLKASMAGMAGAQAAAQISQITGSVGLLATSVRNLGDLRAGIGLLGNSFVGLGRALMSSLGFWGLVGVAAWQLYEVLTKNDRAMADLVERIRETNGEFADTSDIDKLRVSVSELTTEYNEAAAAVEELDRKLKMARNPDSPYVQALQTKRDSEARRRDEAGGKIGERNEAIVLSLKSKYDAELRNAGDYADKMLEDSFREVDSKATAKIAELGKLYDAGKYDEYTRARNEIMLQSASERERLAADAQIQIQANIAAGEQLIEAIKAGNDVNLSDVEKMTKALGGIERVGNTPMEAAKRFIEIQKQRATELTKVSNEMRDAALASQQAIAAGIKAAGNAGSKGGKPDAALEGLKGMLDSALTTAAELRAQIESPGDSGLLAKTEARIESLRPKLKGSVADFEALKAAILEATRQNELNETYLKGEEGLKKMGVEAGKLQAVIDGGTRSTGKWLTMLESGAFGTVEELKKMTAAGEKYAGLSLYEALEKEAERLDEMGKKAAAAAEKLEILVNRSAQLKRTTESLNESFLAPTDRARLSFENDRDAAMELVGPDAQKMLSPEDLAENQRTVDAYMVARQQQLIRDLQGPVPDLVDTWSDANYQIQSLVANTAQGMSDAFVEFAETGKFAVKDMVISILADLAKIQMQKSVLGPLTNMISTGINAWMGNPTAAASSAASSGGYGSNFAGPSEGSLLSNLFANGGIMTEFGPAQLRKYAMGGIADSPQVAIYGEGSMNEAYVPLPDGRTIPVTMNGGQNAMPVDLTVKVINQSGTELAGKQGKTQFDGRQMVTEIVLSEINKPGQFRDGMRQAVRGA